MNKLIFSLSLLFMFTSASSQDSTIKDPITEFVKKSLAEQKKQEEAQAARFRKALKLDSLDNKDKDKDTCWGENKADGSSVRTCR